RRIIHGHELPLFLPGRHESSRARCQENRRGAIDGESRSSVPPPAGQPFLIVTTRRIIRRAERR
ncbi:MAG: hypothetical protein V4477_14845, partial [Pseudomonadota bacterium]